MSTAVADATVLVFLAKLGDLDLLAALFDEVLVPEAVTAEVVDRGRAEGYADAMAIDEATESILAVTVVSGSVSAAATDLQSSAGLGRGESEAIALARSKKARCLTDDHAARTTAEAIGVAVGGTIYVLLAALETGRITADGYFERLDALVDGEFRMSAALYRRAVEAGREVGGE